MGKTIRLDKYLTEMNKGSRSQIKEAAKKGRIQVNGQTEKKTCLLYTSPSPRDRTRSRMPSSA